MSSFMPAPHVAVEDGANSDISSGDLQYLGTIHQSKQKDLPTKRSAISRRSVDLHSLKRDHPSLTSIDSNFRFSPSVTSTTSKINRSIATKPLRTDRFSIPRPLRSSVQPRNPLPHFKKSSLISHPSIKRLYEKKLVFPSSKSLLGLSGKLTGRGKYCTKEAFQYEEKARYKQLLQQYADDSLCSRYGMSKMPSVTTISSDSRSTSPQSVISRTPLDPRWAKEKARQMEATSPQSTPLMAKSKELISQRLGGLNKSAESTIPGITLTNGNTSMQSIKESDDDCQIIAEDIKVKSRRNSLECSLLESPLYDKKWHKELNERYDLRAKMKDEKAKKAAEHHKLCEEVRKKAHTSLEDRIAMRIKQLHLNYPTKIEEVIEDEEEEEPEELPELTQEMMAVIEDALDSRAPGQVLVDKYNIQITRRDIATLSGLNWLNDEVINFYMNLLMERGKNDNRLNVHAFNTFFYPKLMKMGYSSVRRWTKKIDVFKYDLLLVPVHLGMHWCLATIDFRTKHIRYYDSMLGDNTRCLEALMKYLESEHQDKKQSGYDTTGWTLDNVKDIPQQMNGSDCGMFACKFSEYLSRDVKITFDQQHMPYFRRRMIYEIVAGKLLQ